MIQPWTSVHAWIRSSAAARSPAGACLGRVVDVSRTCRGRVVDVSWTCRGRVVDVLSAASRSPSNLGYTSAISAISATPRPHLGHTSTAPRLPRLHLGCTSAVYRLYLGCTSAVSRLYLGYISPSEKSSGLVKAASRRMRERMLAVISHASCEPDFINVMAN